MIFRELSNAVFGFVLRCAGAEIDGGVFKHPPPPPSRSWKIQRPSRARVKAGICSDHSMVDFELVVHNSDKGRGLFKFDNTLLEDIQFVEYSRAEIEKAKIGEGIYLPRLIGDSPNLPRTNDISNITNLAKFYLFADDTAITIKPNIDRNFKLNLIGCFHW